MRLVWCRSVLEGPSTNVPASRCQPLSAEANTSAEEPGAASPASGEEPDSVERHRGSVAAWPQRGKEPDTTAVPASRCLGQVVVFHLCLVPFILLEGFRSHFS